ncbi:hypothetical protein N0V82_010834 [Gnomoniopsis sp. IMI 355080]|nr:hypothetical protein N0V82_010834 [Gnomoniopsis sp. IMI 355080]
MVPHAKKVEVPKNVNLVNPVYADNVPWDHPTLRIDEPTELPEIQQITEEPEHEDINLDLIEPITFPPLRGGPTAEEIDKILRALDHNVSIDEFLDDFLSEVA